MTLSFLHTDSYGSVLDALTKHSYTNKPFLGAILHEGRDSKFFPKRYNAAALAQLIKKEFDGGSSRQVVVSFDSHLSPPIAYIIFSSEEDEELTEVLTEIITTKLI